MNLDQLLTRNPIPSTAEMQSRLDHVWERLQSEIENTATERISIPVSIRPHWVFGRAPWVVAGIALATILVSALIWRYGPPFSMAFRDSNAGEHIFSKSTSQGAETLQIAVPEAFEVASVKLVPSSSQAFQLASMGEASQLTRIGCPGGYPVGRQLVPRRLTIEGATVLSLVMWAYGRDCALVEGGPGWTRSGEYYEIQALLPEGTPSETLLAFEKGNAPRVQRMLQTLLADRFRLVLKRELREMPVYVLTVARPGKMKLSPEETLSLPPNFLPGIVMQMIPSVQRGQLISAPGPRLLGHAVSVSDLARNLRPFAGRIVVDKSGRSDVFDVDLTFAPNVGPSATSTPPATPQSVPPLPGVPSQSTASLQDALEEQLGLKMEAVKMPLEVLVIESVERPSAN